MGYYHIKLRNNASNLCMTIHPWGKYSYKHPPMEFSNSKDIFQQKMNDLFREFYFIYSYIYDLLVSAKLDWTDHVQKLELTLNKLK